MHLPVSSERFSQSSYGAKLKWQDTSKSLLTHSGMNSSFKTSFTPNRSKHSTLLLGCFNGIPGAHNEQNVFRRRPYILFTFKYSYGFMFVMEYDSIFRAIQDGGARSTLYKTRNHLCSHFADYLSNEIRT